MVSAGMVALSCTKHIRFGGQEPLGQVDTSALDEMLKQTSPVECLFPAVSEAERNSVIEAYEQGIARRALCGHLHWGAGKYTTIVKPVLDAYEKRQKP